MSNVQNVKQEISSLDELDRGPPHDVLEKKCWPAVSRGRAVFGLVLPVGRM